MKQPIDEPAPVFDDDALRRRVAQVLEEVEVEELNEKINPKKCGIGAFPMVEPTERRG